MTAADFETRVIGWARARPEVEALVQIGSRAQGMGEGDQWSDWDYHLIVRSTRAFRSLDWLQEIAPCWCAHIEKTERGVCKVSAVFEGGLEADFVPLAAWQMKLVYWAMYRPRLAAFFPRLLIAGVRNTRMIVRPGYKILLGGARWEHRLGALRTEWPETRISNGDLLFHVTAFWRHAVWIQKKILRGESRAALRWHQVEMSPHLWALLEEEARLMDRSPRPEARKAEKWLDAQRLEQTHVILSADQNVLARALLAHLALFEEISASVAQKRGFALPDYSAVATWLRTGLRSLADQP